LGRPHPRHLAALDGHILVIAWPWTYCNPQPPLAPTPSPYPHSHSPEHHTARFGIETPTAHAPTHPTCSQSAHLLARDGQLFQPLLSHSPTRRTASDPHLLIRTSTYKTESTSDIAAASVKYSMLSLLTVLSLLSHPIVCCHCSCCCCQCCRHCLLLFLRLLLSALSLMTLVSMLRLLSLLSLQLLRLLSLQFVLQMLLLLQLLSLLCKPTRTSVDLPLQCHRFVNTRALNINLLSVTTVLRKSPVSQLFLWVAACFLKKTPTMRRPWATLLRAASTQRLEVVYAAPVASNPPLLPSAPGEPLCWPVRQLQNPWSSHEPNEGAATPELLPATP